MIAKKGNIVKLEYEGRLENGEVFDSSQHGDHSHPLEFEVGSGQVIGGFDKAVTGMKEGEEKEFSIEPEDAYGMPNPNLIRKFPRKILPAGEEAQEGMVLILGTPQGQQVPAKILDLEDDEVTLDLNHPLAGKKLVFKIKLISVD